MTRVAPTIAAEDQVLCEGCGYVLSGLPAGANCPECGQDAAASDPTRRRLPAWEDPSDGRPGVVRFVLTTLAVTFRPAAFYRSLVTRHDGRGAYAFAVVHWALSAVMLGTAVDLHLRWFTDFPQPASRAATLFAPLLVIGVYLFLEITTSVAARLTRWEAAYRGLRMPVAVVLRAMYYHAAHYVPVGAAVLATVTGYAFLLASGTVSGLTTPAYVYVLCGEVVVAAFYLFKTYWIAMRNVMYANR
jgi:hypothetical protein